MSGVAASPGDPRLAGLVVHWHDEENLARLLAAWPPDDPRFELVIVDNGSTAPPLPRAPARWIDAGRNLGFAGGINRAAAAASPSVEFLLWLNPDARPRPGALAALLEGFALHPEAAGLAPRLDGAGGAQWRWQLARLPRRTDLVRRAWFLEPRLAPAIEPGPGSPVEQPAAAALAVRRRVFDTMGGLDPGFFPAWYEDVDFAARARAAGQTFLYWPAAVFDHARGGSLAALGFDRFYWLHDRHLVRYARRHHGALFAGALQLQLAVATLLRTALLARRPRWAERRADALRALAIKELGALTSWRAPAGLARDLAPAGALAPRENAAAR